MASTGPAPLPPDGLGLRSVGAVVVDCDGVIGELDGAGLWTRLCRLSSLGVHAVVAGGEAAQLLGPGLDVRPDGPGRLFLWSGQPPEVLEVGPRWPVAGELPPGPLASRDDGERAAQTQPAPGGPDAYSWAREWLVGEGGPENVLLLGIGGAEAGMRAGEGRRVHVVLASPDDAEGALGCLDDVAAAHGAFPAAVSDPAWQLEVEGFDPLREGEVESWLAVANGRTGTRGVVEEGGRDSAPALYVAGVFGHVEGRIGGPELLQGPDWTRLHPQAGGEPVSLAAGRTIEHRRVLDLRQGILFRQWRQQLPSGREWTFRSARFASLADRGILALQAEASAGDAPVCLADGIPLAEPQDAVASSETRTEGERTLVTLRGNRGQGASFAVSTREGSGRVERFVAVHRSWGDDPAERPEKRLDQAEIDGIAALRARHRVEWRARWHDADVTIKGDLELQRQVRFALAHLIASGDPESDVASIGARALTGPGYRGHVFWDTDVFVLPFLIWTHPPTARALLAYRHRTLPAAHAKAAAMGYSGALYAWESADSGDETTPRFAWRPDGTRVEVLTGLMEHHISADVAWATWQYWQVTGDDAFLVAKGAELILETARFWASRAERGDDGRFHIGDVIGPDEYHEGVADNAFTNVLARWNLRTAVALCDILPKLDRAGWDRLEAHLGLRPSETTGWTEVAEGLVDGFDPRSLLYEQFAGFLGLEDLRAADMAPRPFSADTLLGAERVRHAQVVKQADVLMLAHMLPDVVPPDVTAANYRYYEPRTSHGSSLSPPVHASVAARVGALDEAERYFRMAAGIDLDDHMGNAAHGLHMATMGGLWQAAVFGFGGLRVDGSALRIDPRLPSAWEGLTFPVRWRGCRLRLDVGPQELRIDVEGPARVAVGTGPPRPLERGCFAARRQGAEWSELEPSPD